MMMSETDMAERISRAREQNMEAHVVSEDPLIVEVENHDSEDGDAVHTVLPRDLYCECGDHRARVTLCKHLIFLALGEDESVSDEVRDATREAITDMLRDLEDEEMELRSRLREIADERTQAETVRHALPVPDYFGDDDLGSGGQMDAEQALEALEEADEEIVQELEEADEEEQSDDDESFRDMIEDLQQ